MFYRSYKLTFPGAVHFGDLRLESSEYTFHSDTLFSALCIEALNVSVDMLNTLVEHVQSGKLIWSDAFPYIGNELFIPKPYIRIEGNTAEQGDSVLKKKYKKLKYIQASLFSDYLAGIYPVDRVDDINELGIHVTKTSASINGEEETVPYRIGEFLFNENCGLYLIVSFDDEKTQSFFDRLFMSLSHTGIGGRRSSGLGKFSYESDFLPESIIERLQSDSKRYELLSLAMCDDMFLEEILEDAEYSLIKRGGFIHPSGNAASNMKKKDVYMFASGSCFFKKFKGRIIDVSTVSDHPVYRNAMPLFLGVDR